MVGLCVNTFHFLKTNNSIEIDVYKDHQQVNYFCRISIAQNPNHLKISTGLSKKLKNYNHIWSLFFINF